MPKKEVVEEKGYTTLLRDNECGTCGGELKAEDGHFHEAIPFLNSFPTVVCCKCKEGCNARG